MANSADEAMSFGVAAFVTARGIDPAELAELAEDRGFESLLDPFLALVAAARHDDDPSRHRHLPRGRPRRRWRRSTSSRVGGSCSRSARAGTCTSCAATAPTRDAGSRSCASASRR
jgi:hypothetical protein